MKKTFVVALALFVVMMIGIAQAKEYKTWKAPKGGNSISFSCLHISHDPDLINCFLRVNTTNSTKDLLWDDVISVNISVKAVKGVAWNEAGDIAAVYINSCFEDIGGTYLILYRFKSKTQKAPKKIDLFEGLRKSGSYFGFKYIYLGSGKIPASEDACVEIENKISAVPYIRILKDRVEYQVVGLLDVGTANALSLQSCSNIAELQKHSWITFGVEYITQAFDGKILSKKHFFGTDHHDAGDGYEPDWSN